MTQFMNMNFRIAWCRGLVLLLPVFLSACATLNNHSKSEKADAETAAVAEAPAKREKPRLLTAEERVPRDLTPRDLLPEMDAPVQEKEARFNVVADGVPAQAFFNSLVDGTDDNIVVHPDVSGLISMNLRNVTVKDALKAVRDTYGYDFITSDYGIQILPAELQTKIFPINYLNVKRFGRSGMRVSTGKAEDSSEDSGGDTADEKSKSLHSSEVETESGSDFWSDLQRTLKLMTAKDKDSQVVIDAHAGLVIVRAMPLTVSMVQNYLERTELTVLRQVLIEAKIVEVELKDGFQAGINWNTIAAQSGKNDVWGTQTSVPLENDDLIGGIFTLNVDAGDFLGALSLLETQGDVDVLSSPRIATVNNQKAVIKVGSDEYFVTNIKNTTTSTSTTTSDTPEIELTPFFSGIALDVTPQIGEEDEITLHVHPTVTDVTEKQKVIELNGDEYSLPLAFSEVRETDSIIRARSGQIVVIGGLMQNKNVKTVAKVPVLGSIPLLGGLFRQTREEKMQSELVILIQPKIIDSQISPQLIEEMNRKYSRVMMPGI